MKTKRPLGGNKDTFTDEQTAVECWEQSAGHAEVETFEKKGMNVSRKVYFGSDPGVTLRHQILITQREGVAVSSPIPLDVVSTPLPDASAGRGILYKVLCDEETGERD